MRFEDFPEAIDPDEARRALDRAASLDDGRAEGLRECGERMASGMSVDSGLAETLVAIEGLACQFMFGEGEARRRNGSALVPWIEMDGKVSPPPVAAFPDGARGYLAERASLARRVDVRARLHDFRWERWRDVTGARGAIDTYMEATTSVDLADDGSAQSAVDYLVRAAELALAINYRRDHVRDRLATEIRRSIGGPNLGYPCWLLERTADLLTQDGELSVELTRLVIDGAKEAGRRSDRHSERAYLEAAMAIAAAGGRHDQARMLRLSCAKSVEAEAVERAGEGGLIETALLTQALKLYQNAGDGPSVRRIRTRLPQANKRAMEQMHTIGVETAISNDDIESAVAGLLAATSSDPAAIRAVPRQMGFWPDWTSVERERLDHESAFMRFASTTILEHDGRSVPLPDEQAARDLALTTRQFAQRTAILVGLTEIAVGKLRDRGQWTRDSVVAAVGSVDVDLGRACEPGIRAFEVGDYWTALHVLTPQVERAIRLIGLRIDAPIHRITSAERLTWAPLDPMLEDPIIQAALGRDFARELQALFTDQYGPNIRNSTAHGAADLDAPEGPAMICLMTILAIADVLTNLPETEPVPEGE